MEKSEKQVKLTYSEKAIALFENATLLGIDQRVRVIDYAHELLDENKQIQGLAIWFKYAKIKSKTRSRSYQLSLRIILGNATVEQDDTSERIIIKGREHPIVIKFHPSKAQPQYAFAE